MTRACDNKFLREQSRKIFRAALISAPATLKRNRLWKTSAKRDALPSHREAFENFSLEPFREVDKFSARQTNLMRAKSHGSNSMSEKKQNVIMTKIAAELSAPYANIPSRTSARSSTCRVHLSGPMSFRAHARAVNCLRAA